MVWRHIATVDSMLCWKFPHLARWQVEQINMDTGTALDVDSMKFRSPRSASAGVWWATHRLPLSARAVLYYRARQINRRTP
jgi:hypothetical protein